VEWFKHIEIAEQPDVPQLLFSVKVTTELTEHSLILKEAEAQSLQAQRLYPGQLLQIVWLPYDSGKGKEYKLSEMAKEMRACALPAAIQLEYEARTLARSRKKNDDNARQFHAAGVTAFTVLVYCCLWQIIKRLKGTHSPLDSQFTTLMLRLQESGKSAENDGEDHVYAAAQSVEAMLAQDTPVHMQGIVLDNVKSSNRSARYVKSGSFDALLSAFPLVIQTKSKPAVERIGLISYATRPTDEMPGQDQGDRNSLFLTQSYIASAVEQPFMGYELRSERMQSDIVTTLEDLQKQRIVREEIGHLQRQGCQHIILLSHAYGSRHITAPQIATPCSRPSPFWKKSSKRFPTSPSIPCCGMSSPLPACENGAMVRPHLKLPAPATM